MKMAMPLLKGRASIALTGVRGAPLRLRPCLIQALRPEKPTRIVLVDGSSVFVKESVDEIIDMISKGAGRMLAGVAPYSQMRSLEEDGLPPLPFIFDGGSQLEKAKLEALKEVAYNGAGGSSLRRLAGIYKEMLVPFTFFSRPGSQDGLSSLDRRIWGAIDMSWVETPLSASFESPGNGFDKQKSEGA